MTEVLIDSVSWSVEVQELDWWSDDTCEKVEASEPKLAWMRGKTEIPTRAEAENARDLFAKVYKGVRIIKVVKYIDN